MVVNILLDQKTIKDVRFSVGKAFWLGYDFYDELEERTYGTFTQWGNSKNLLPRIEWDDGEKDTQLSA